MKEELRIGARDATWVRIPVRQLTNVWENALEEMLAPAEHYV
jgi:hypothetical protein